MRFAGFDGQGMIVPAECRCHGPPVEPRAAKALVPGVDWGLQRVRRILPVVFVALLPVSTGGSLWVLARPCLVGEFTNAWSCYLIAGTRNGTPQSMAQKQRNRGMDRPTLDTLQNCSRHGLFLAMIPLVIGPARGTAFILSNRFHPDRGEGLDRWSAFGRS